MVAFLLFYVERLKPTLCLELNNVEAEIQRVLDGTGCPGAAWESRRVAFTV